MKYIKAFEDVNDYQCICWKIYTRDPYLHIVLKNIGVSSDKIDEWFNSIRNQRIESIYFYHDYFNNGRDVWLWHDEFIPENNNKEIIFMGDAKATPEQIEQFEIEKNIEKYNL